MTDFAARCQVALKKAVWQEQQGLPPYLYADALDGVRVADRAQPADPRIVYFIGASRSVAAIMISRLLQSLYHQSHLFLIHVDLKTDAETYDKLVGLTTSAPNIHILSTRRLVQWGAWTMVATMLDALRSIIDRHLDFDFFINLSDVDISLRTNQEIVDFLRPYKGRQFVQVHQGTGEWLERARNFTGAHAVVECGGYGYVAVNSSAIDLGGGQPTCCFGRGGPVLYVNDTRIHMRELREAQEAEALATSQSDTDHIPHFSTGSQWVILDRAFCSYLINDATAQRWMRVFERRFLPDESFVQTVLMHSQFRQTLINANLRYIFWPHFHGDPVSYWQRMGWSFVGGPQVINASEAPGVFRSPYMFARKFDPGVDAEAVLLWDDWMGKKLMGEADPLQEPLGGWPKQQFGKRGGGETHAGTRPMIQPKRVHGKSRLVRSIVFEDGSTCDCGFLCHEHDNCCTDWQELCPSHAEQDEPPPPPCPVPAEPPLASATDAGEAVTLTFINFARYPVRLHFVREDSAQLTEVGVLPGHGRTLTFESATNHAWVARSFSGITVLELPPFLARPPRDTIEVDECDLSTSGSTLHFGWQ